MKANLESARERGEPEFKIPKLRFVIETNEEGEKELQDVRARYWDEREKERVLQVQEGGNRGAEGGSAAVTIWPAVC